ncbi:MAG: hypothetical protein ACR2QH_14630, partial [Geminicoccaceae bacterium]
MSERFSASQQAVFDQIDEKTFWAIASAHRTELQRGAGEAAAFEAALTVLSHRFPMISRRAMAVITEAIVA